MENIVSISEKSTNNIICQLSKTDKLRLRANHGIFDFSDCLNEP